MSETIHEQIAAWIAAALDGHQDPGATLTLRAVRPKVLDWIEEDFKHGDVIVAADFFKTGSSTNQSRYEEAYWVCSGIILELPANTVADTVLSRMAETIRRLLLAGNAKCLACGGLAKNIDCPQISFEPMTGGVIVEVQVRVVYATALKDGYIQA